MTDNNRYIIVLEKNKSPYIENINNVKDPAEYFHKVNEKTYSNPYITCIESPYENIYYIYKDKRHKYSGMKLTYAEKIIPFFGEV
jgi:hypothetical protein